MQVCDSAPSVIVCCSELRIVTCKQNFPCSIVSGVVPKEPVVAKTSGLVFEKSLVEKVLKVEEKCPVTGAPLRSEDLIVVQGS